MNRSHAARFSKLATLAVSTTLAAFLGASAAPRDTFQVQPLTSNGSQSGTQADANLVNAWGLAASPTSPWWVSSNGMKMSLLFDGTGAPQSLSVQIPGAPTGIVFNGGGNFMITDGTNSGPARFLFATEDGLIAGWNPGVPPANPSTQAFTAVDGSVRGAVYKGLAIATTVAGDRLYAADFRNGRIDVFDGSFAPVAMPEAFVDPKLPEGFAPFNVQVLNGRVFVAYARRDPATNDEVRGQGLGVVDVFDTEGRLLARVATRGQLNAPWGMAIAPTGFGSLGGRLLVGNFGDGTIQSFRMSDDMLSFSPGGVLRDDAGKPIVIDGLWGIAFGNDQQAGPAGTLFFTAGPQEEQAGLFGSITPVP